MAPEATIGVVLIDPSGRVRTHEMAVLRAAGMDVHLVTSMATLAHPPAADVVVADLRPSESPPAVVLRLAFELQLPVVVITTAGQVDARLAALRHGSVDHVVAPTEARELVGARPPRRPTRAGSGRAAATRACSSTRCARIVRLGNRSASLTPAELAVLEVLVERAGQVVTKAEIGEALPSHPQPNTVEVHVSALRRKLADIGAPHIKTVHGRGYVYRAVPTSPEAVVRVADLVAERRRLVRQREEFVRRRNEIVQGVERRPTARPPGPGRATATADVGRGPPGAEGRPSTLGADVDGRPGPGDGARRAVGAAPPGRWPTWACGRSSAPPARSCSGAAWAAAPSRTRWASTSRSPPSAARARAASSRASTRSPCCCCGWSTATGRARRGGRDARAAGLRRGLGGRAGPGGPAPERAADPAAPPGGPDPTASGRSSTARPRRGAGPSGRP